MSADRCAASDSVAFLEAGCQHCELGASAIRAECSRAFLCATHTHAALPLMHVGACRLIVGLEAGDGAGGVGAVYVACTSHVSR